MEAVKAREAAVAPLLKPVGGQPVQALHAALQDPPYQTRTEAVKNASYDVVARSLAAVKEAEIEAAVNSLSYEQCDVLMKYLYRGLGQPNKKHEIYQVLLKWHPLVLKRGGQACIMRAISEVKEAL